MSLNQFIKADLQKILSKFFSYLFSLLLTNFSFINIKINIFQTYIVIKKFVVGSKRFKKTIIPLISYLSSLFETQANNFLDKDISILIDKVVKIAIIHVR